MGYFYTDENNQVQGPFPVDQLHELRKAGTIQDATFVIEENGADWKSYVDTFSAPALKNESGLSATPATTTLYTLTHTGPINLRQIQIAKKTQKAILLHDYTRLADGTKKKLLMIGIDNITKTPQDAVRTFLKAQEQRIVEAQALLEKEKNKLVQARKILEELEGKKPSEEKPSAA